MERTFIPTLLLADAGLPMIVLTLPGMLALLVPVVWIEASLCRKWLGLTTRAAVKSNLVANVASTLLGVPAAWFLAFLFEFLIGGTISAIFSFERWNSPLARVIETIFGPAWLSPDEKNLYWMIPVATIALLIPTFLISVWIEARVMCRMLEVAEEDSSGLSRTWTAVRNANLVTYGLLASGSSIWLLISVVKHRQ